MSTVTFAMPTVLDGPLPEAPPYALLNMPGVLKPPADSHWMSGARVYGYPEDEPGFFDPCSSGTSRVKDEADEGFSTPLFGAVTVYLPIQCSAMSIGDPDEFRDRGRVTLEAVESWAVERILSQGVPGMLNPFFSDGNVQVLASGAAVSAKTGLSYLENAIGETGRMGMLHAEPAIAARWFGHPLVPDPPVLRTGIGTPVAVGGGYIGSHPSGQAGPSAGKSWAFATGPVEVRHAEVNVLDIKEVLDRTSNDVVFRAERTVLADWDTALQAAVLIDWTL